MLILIVAAGGWFLAEGYPAGMIFFRRKFQERIHLLKAFQAIRQ